ncbi:MAG: DNA-directed RNA polymerase subunit H [Candidatus Diapherotrites archaeon CG09_land_8_20_14_0_10_32_12]|nr:MAG: DNA-directed RNA polymerase subunit H [Candidatus Diapherotrites archaeon CG09_land_8_20_14_0_10_32_12]
MKNINLKKHVLVPEHSKLIKKEIQELLEKYNLSLNELPKIILTDPAITSLNVKLGDVIKITRDSPTAGKSIYYRVVING